MKVKRKQGFWIKDNQIRLQTLRNVPWEARSEASENHCFTRPLEDDTPSQLEREVRRGSQEVGKIERFLPAAYECSYALAHPRAGWASVNTWLSADPQQQ